MLVVSNSPSFYTQLFACKSFFFNVSVLTVFVCNFLLKEDKILVNFTTGAPETAAENIAAVPLTAAVNDSLSLTQTSSINLEDPSSKPNIERTLKVLEQLANQIHVNVASPSSNSNLAGLYFNKIYQAAFLC